MQTVTTTESKETESAAGSRRQPIRRSHNRLLVPFQAIVVSKNDGTLCARRSVCLLFTGGTPGGGLSQYADRRINFPLYRLPLLARLVSGEDTQGARGVFMARAATSIGFYSYSIYLWHRLIAFVLSARPSFAAFLDIYSSCNRNRHINVEVA